MERRTAWWCRWDWWCCPASQTPRTRREWLQWQLERERESEWEWEVGRAEIKTDKLTEDVEPEAEVYLGLRVHLALIVTLVCHSVLPLLKSSSFLPLSMTKYYLARSILRTQSSVAGGLLTDTLWWTIISLYYLIVDVYRVSLVNVMAPLERTTGWTPLRIQETVRSPRLLTVQISLAVFPSTPAVRGERWEVSRGKSVLHLRCSGCCAGLTGQSRELNWRMFAPPRRGTGPCCHILIDKISELPITLSASVYLSEARMQP